MPYQKSCYCQQKKTRNQFAFNICSYNLPLLSFLLRMLQCWKKFKCKVETQQGLFLSPQQPLKLQITPLTTILYSEIVKCIKKAITHSLLTLYQNISRQFVMRFLHIMHGHFNHKESETVRSSSHLVLTRHLDNPVYLEIRYILHICGTMQKISSQKMVKMACSSILGLFLLNVSTFLNCCHCWRHK